MLLGVVLVSISENWEKGGGDLPCLTDILVDRYRPPITARDVHAPCPITVPNDTRYTFYHRRETRPAMEKSTYVISTKRNGSNLTSITPFAQKRKNESLYESLAEYKIEKVSDSL